MINNLPIDFSNIIIVFYGVILLPFSKILKNYFELILKSPNIKNILLNIGFYLFFSSIIIGYFLSLNSYIFLIFTLYIFLLSFEVNMYSLFGYGIITFLGFLYYLPNNDSYIYSNYLFFSLFGFILGIFSYLFSNFINIGEIIGKYGNKILSSLAIICSLIIILSFYFTGIQSYNIYVLLIFMFFYNLCNKYLENEKIKYQKDYKKDLIVIGLFFITIIPIINNLLITEEKNSILLFSTILFLLTYTGYNLIIKKAL